MSKAQMKEMIETAAKASSATPAAIITAMQGELAKWGDEAGLAVLCEIKREYI